MRIDTKMPYWLAILAAMPLISNAQSKVCVVRPENNGGINILPVKIVVRGPKVPTQFASLMGGQKDCFAIRPGPFSVRAASAKPYSDGSGDTAECKSNVLSFIAKEGDRLTISIEPRSNGPEYICGWRLKLTRRNHRE